MILSRGRLRRLVSTALTVLTLALLAALAALAISLFLDSFSRHESTEYEPKDIHRERLLKQRPASDETTTNR